MATSEALIDAVLWVSDHLEDEEKPEKNEVPRGPKRTMWVYAGESRAKFFEKFVPLAMVFREKAEAVSGEGLARELEEKEIARLEKRLAGFMSGRKRTFCEKCWTELGDELGPVEVVHLKGKPA